MLPWLLALAGGAALLLLLGLFLSSRAMNVRPQSLEASRAWQEQYIDLSWLEKVQKKDYLVSCTDGYLLHVHLLGGTSPSSKMVILSHGYTDNHIGSLKYARMYLQLGFDVLVYDLRGHGENAPDFCSYAVREGRDLNALIRDTRKRFPGIRFLGIHGESLGGATSIASLREHPDIDFVVDDCGFSEISSILKAGMRRLHVPSCFFPVASLCARLRYGLFFHEMRPIDSLRSNTVPILFIHGLADDFIPPYHSEAMARANPARSELFLVPGAPHARSIFTDPEGYARAVADFLKSLNIPVEDHP